jgi:hypothetical protein
MNLFRVLAGGTALTLVIPAGAQFTGNPEPTPAFPVNEVGVVEVTCPGFNLILHPDSVWSDYLHPATLVWSTSAGSDTLEEVGFRLRGNTSRMAAKKSFKVDVNAFVPGRQWHGLEKLNLNGEHNDPSVVRARVVWDVFRAAGLPAPRTGHVELHVNGEYRGVYLHIEHVDEEWIRKRFADDGGNLWKCTYPADLSYQGPDGSDYQYFPPWSSTQRVYALQTNRSEDDYSAIARLASVLYLTPNADLPCALEEVFDVQLYLRTAAAEILAGHWDNYIGNRNNFYLYERPSDGRIAYLAYDVDNSLGIEWGGNWVNADPFAWTSENRPLYTRLMDIPQYREDLAWHIRDLLEGAFAAEEVGAAAAAHVALIAPAAETDVFRTYDYGFSYGDFLASVDEAWGNHVVWGIADFAAVRSFWADVQTEDAPDAPRSLLAWAEGPTLDGVVRLHAQVTGPATAVVAEVDGGDVGCTQEAPGMWACSVPASSPSSLVRVVAEFPGGVVRHSPCDPVRVWTAPAETPFVLLNEVMPLNNSYISDASGTYGDWVELYNPGPQPRFIGNAYLTDRLDLPRRWRLPNVTLNAGDHLLLWCGDRPEAGPLHAPFALDAAGEGLYLLLEELGALRIQDAFTWDAAFPNVSWGRSTDGAADWVAFSAGGLPPTPDGPNGTPAGIARPGSACTPVVPNPVAVGTPVALNGPAQVVAMTGAVVWRSTAPEGTWTPSAPGVYVVHRASCPVPIRVLALAAGGPG